MTLSYSLHARLSVTQALNPFSGKSADKSGSIGFLARSMIQDLRTLSSGSTRQTNPPPWAFCHDKVYAITRCQDHTAGGCPSRLLRELILSPGRGSPREAPGSPRPAAPPGNGSDVTSVPTRSAVGRCSLCALSQAGRVHQDQKASGSPVSLQHSV